MNERQFKVLCSFREDFKKQVKKWSLQCSNLMELQKKASGDASYSFETPVVYNQVLDSITLEDDIKLIVIADNPGKDEQLKKNNRYLVGQAGKIAEGYFCKNKELNIDFRKNVIILNKTPVHSAKTTQLKAIMKDKEASELILESQLWMAEKTAQLLLDYNSGNEKKAEIWLVGYSELKAKGIFEPYRLKLYERLSDTSEWNKVYVFQHFSMNRFIIDLKNYIIADNSAHIPLIESIHRLGNTHKREIFNSSDN
ncbi:MAG: hypothetical protein IKX23_07595 [Treponema sp.]|nr:hypothetical protein [Treponema sp.]